MRSLPQTRAMPRLARAWLDPNGGHRLEVSMGGGSMCFTRDDIDWMRRAIDSFEREAIFADGREAVVYRRHSRPLEVD